MLNFPKNFYLIGALLLCIQATLLYIFGQPIISLTGKVLLWTSTVNGPENSQQISDWYTLSHIIHGFLFFWFLYFIKNRFYPNLKIWHLTLFAMVLESAWELLENSPIIIDRYREATLGVGYRGDSILNSICDNLWMLSGFLFAYKFNWKIVLGVLVAFELIALLAIRDNLTLNILMLTYPLDIILQWQQTSINLGIFGL